MYRSVQNLLQWSVPFTLLFVNNGSIKSCPYYFILCLNLSTDVPLHPEPFLRSSFLISWSTVILRTGQDRMSCMCGEPPTANAQSVDCGEQTVCVCKWEMQIWHEIQASASKTAWILATFLIDV